MEDAAPAPATGGMNAEKEAGQPPPQQSPSNMMGLLSLLRALRDEAELEYVDHLMGRLAASTNEREWALLRKAADGVRPQLAALAARVHTTLLEFVARLRARRERAGEAPAAAASAGSGFNGLSEEANFSYRVLAVASDAEAAAQQGLKPLFAEIEAFLDARGDVRPPEPALFRKAVRDMSAADAREVEAGVERARAMRDGEGGGDGAEGAGPEGGAAPRQWSEAEARGEEEPVTHAPPSGLESISSSSGPEGEAPARDRGRGRGGGRHDRPPASMDRKSLREFAARHAEGIRRANEVVDQYLLAALTQAVGFSMAVALQNPSSFAATQGQAEALGAHLARHGLPVLRRLLRLEASLVPVNVYALSVRGVERGAFYRPLRQLVRKCRLLHEVLGAVDVVMFPRTVRCHAGGLKCSAVSNVSSQFVATCGYDRMVRVWDTSTGQCLAQFAGHSSVVVWCSFNSVDTWLASASFDGTARVWNSRTGAEVAVLAGHDDGVAACALHSDDDMLATGSLDCTVRLWSVKQAKCLRVYRAHRHWVKAVHFTPCGRHLVSAGLDKQIFVWEAARALPAGTSSVAPAHAFRLHEDHVLALVCPAPGMLLSSSKDNTVRSWDLRTGRAGPHVGAAAAAAAAAPPPPRERQQHDRRRHPQQHQHQHRSAALSLAVSPGGGVVAAAFFDNTVELYRTTSLQRVRRITVHNDGILCVSFQDESTLLIGTASGAIQVVPF